MRPTRAQEMKTSRTRVKATRAAEGLAGAAALVTVPKN